jgi:hypothetical protein
MQQASLPRGLCPGFQPSIGLKWHTMDKIVKGSLLDTELRNLVCANKSVVGDQAQVRFGAPVSASANGSRRSAGGSRPLPSQRRVTIEARARSAGY